MSERLSQLLDDLDRLEAAAAKEAGPYLADADFLQTASREECVQLLEEIMDRRPSEGLAADLLLRRIFQQLLLRQQAGGRGVTAQEMDDLLVALLAAVYRHLEPGCTARELIPALLVAARTPRALLEVADLLVDDPPRDAELAAAALAPLFLRVDYDPNWLFPRLLNALVHAPVAAVVLDLANFLTSQGHLPRHPAAEHATQLAALLGGLAGQLGRLESEGVEGTEAIRRRSLQVSEGVALAVALCHALALIGDRSVVGKLYQIAELSHRRLRAEATAALAQLGEAAGRQQLLELASEPSVRLRVLAYAEQLGFLDQVPEEYRTAQARAESELVLWLAQPAQLGFPPTHCEPLEHRELYWPGYDEPVDCFLFRFTYEFPEAVFTHLGLAGPATYAFTADLADLPPDDIFAAFAGWSAEHEEMYEFDAETVHEGERPEIARLERRLRDEGYDAIRPVKLCLFFGDRVLVAEALRGGQAGVAVTDPLQTTWLPRSASSRPPGAHEAYCIYKGRRLLRTFNETPESQP